MALLSACLLLLLSAPALAVVLQQGGLRISVLSQIIPYRLPRHGTAPIAVFVSGHLSTESGAIPPQLQRLSIEVNRHGLLQSTGLPVCRPSQIEAAPSQEALAGCRHALIGSGQFWANILFPGQAPYPTQGRLLIFNGRTECALGRHRSTSGRVAAPGPPNPFLRAALTKQINDAGRIARGAHFEVRDPQRPDRGHRYAQASRASKQSKSDSSAQRASAQPFECQSRPELLAHIFTTHPFNTAFVIPFAIRRISKGPYATQLSASLPEALGSWGYLDRIKLTLRRDYTYRGRRLSYFNAGCPAPPGATRTAFPLAYVKFSFAQHAPLGATVEKTCGVRG